MGYTKLFNEILLSTVWAEPDHVRLVWITMLAMKDDRHQVMSSDIGLSKMANVDLKKVKEAIVILESPDLESRSKEFDGRRIEKIDGGWKILNGEKYRKRMSEEDRKEYKKQWMRDFREKEKIKVVERNVDFVDKVENVDNVDTTEQNRTEHNNKEKYKKEKKELNERFEKFWAVYPKKVGKNISYRAFCKLNPNQGITDTMIVDCTHKKSSDMWMKDGGQYIPNPSTYINQRRWEDVVEIEKEKSWKEKFMQSVKEEENDNRSI